MTCCLWTPDYYFTTFLQPTTRLFFFFFNDTATTEIYTLSLHDALPISWIWRLRWDGERLQMHSHTGAELQAADIKEGLIDRKSTRLNSSHLVISYAVFCLKKKKSSDLALAVHFGTRIGNDPCEMIRILP